MNRSPYSDTRFVVEIKQYPQNERVVTMTNCGPYSSGHARYGDRQYRRVTQSSLNRLYAWIGRNWCSTNRAIGWYLVTRG